MGKIRRDLDRFMKRAADMTEALARDINRQRYQEAMETITPPEISDGQALSVPTTKLRVSTEGTDKAQVKNTIRENDAAAAYVRMRLKQRPEPPLEDIFMELFEANNRRGVGVIGCLLKQESENVTVARKAGDHLRRKAQRC